MSGGRDRADWVRNLMRNPHVSVELGNQTRAGIAHPIEPDSTEDRLARNLLVSKYADAEDDLREWGRNSLPVVIEFPQTQAYPPAGG